MMEYKTTYEGYIEEIEEYVEIPIVIEFSIENNSFDHKFGTRYLPDEVEDFYLEIDDKKINETVTRKYAEEILSQAKNDNKWETKIIEEILEFHEENKADTEMERKLGSQGITEELRWRR